MFQSSSNSNNKHITTTITTFNNNNNNNNSNNQKSSDLNQQEMDKSSQLQLRAEAPMFSQQFERQEEVSRTREVNIVTPDYNHLR